jgi:squalene-associated FAD-dependent desaturase
VSERRAIVVGGGLAGIVAALDCAEAGARVTLLEVRPRLGGAAYSFEREGLWLDNGQHVFLRCCEAYRGLLERLGSTGRVSIQSRLEIPVLSPAGRPTGAPPTGAHSTGAHSTGAHSTGGRSTGGRSTGGRSTEGRSTGARSMWDRSTGGRPIGDRSTEGRSTGPRMTTLRRGVLPAPLHLAGALARYPHLTLLQRARAARAALALARLSPGDARERERLEGTTLGEWLAEHGQDETAVAALWDLIALPTLNLPAAEGSLELGAFVLRTGLLERRDAGDIGFHMRPLGETLGGPAERALARAGVEVRLGVRAEAVERVELVGGAGASGERPHAYATPREDRHERRMGRLRVRASDGELEGDVVICAVPHPRAAVLLEPLLGSETESWKALGESPIVNVHVVYDRRVCDVRFAAGVGTPVQYVFDRTDAAGLAEGQCLAVSLSGAVEEMGMETGALRERYLEALRELFPRARKAVVRGVHVSREHAATFRAGPGSGALRPRARTSVPGLVLAGAWTDTGWPATLEGAVLSGHAAAREAMIV